MVTATRTLDRDELAALGRGLAEGLAENGVLSRDMNRSNEQFNPYGLGSKAYLGSRHTTPTGTAAVGRYAHGPTGLFTLPGVDPTLYSAIIGMRSLSSLLPAASSVDTNPLFTTLTGVQDDVGTEPEDPCDDPPVAGLLKACTQTSIFGRYSRMTPEVDIRRFGQRVNRGDPMDLTVANNPADAGIASIFQPSQAAGASLGSAVLRETEKILFEFATSVQRLLVQEVWVGNPANNTVGGGSRHMTGLNLLLQTGKVDAETGVACPALDPDVKDFNYLCIEDNPGDIVDVLDELWKFTNHNANMMGFGAVNYVFAMREDLFDQLTEVWPCAYFTSNCSVGDNAQDRQTIDATRQIALRDEMRQGQFLLIRGLRIPVIFDDGIPEDSNANNGNLNQGQFASDIYLLPLSVLGGRSVLHFEYFDYGNADAQNAIRTIGGQGNFLTTNGGAWLWHFKPPLNWCIQALATSEPRLILRTPMLAGRLQNVCYAPLQHNRQPFPDDPYFTDGGQTGPRPAPSFFNEWQS